MKQLKLLFTVLFLAVLGLGNVWATEVVYKTAKFGSAATSGSSSGYTTTWNSVTSGFSVSVANGNTNGTTWAMVKFGRKGNASVGSITTSAAIDKKVTKVVINIDAITASNVNSIKLYSGTTAECSTEVGEYNTAAGNQTVTLSNPTANLFYKVVFDCKSGSGNGFVAVKTVEYYYDNAEDTPADCSTPTITFAEGTEVAKLTTDAAFTNAASVEYESTATGQTITYSVEAGKEGVATVNASTGEVTIVGAGTAKIYASVEANATYCEKSAYYTLTVTAPVVPFTGETWEIAASDLTVLDASQSSGYAKYAGTQTKDGVDYNITAVMPQTGNMQMQKNTGVLYNESTFGKIAKIVVTSTSTVLSLYEGEDVAPAVTKVTGVSADGDITYTLSGNNGYFKLVNGNGTTAISKIIVYYYPVKSTIILASCENGSVGVDGIADLTQVKAGTIVTLTNTPAAGYKLAEYSVVDAESNPVTVTDGKFTMPASNVTFSATFEVAKVLESVAITTPATKTVFYKGEAFSSDGLVLTATFSTGNEVVTPTSFSGFDNTTVGEQTITVSFTEGTTTKTATYTVEVKTIANTQETAYTVAQALDIIKLGVQTDTEIYVKGIVMAASAIGTYGNSNIDIKDAGTDGSNFVRCFRCVDLGNQNFTEDYVGVGDTVVVLGKPYDYVNKGTHTYELNAGCYLVEYKKFNQPKTDISNTPETAYTAAQAIALYNDATSDLTKAVYVKGVVASKPSLSTSGEWAGSYYQVTEENGFVFFHMYQGADKAKFTEDIVVAKDTLIAYGTLTKYNSTYELENCYMYSRKAYVAIPETVVINETTPSVEVNATVTLTATVTPAEAANKTVTWAIIAGSEYASVDASTGVVTGLAEGTATIQVTTVVGGKTATVEVAVIAVDTRKTATNGEAAFEAISGSLNSDITFEARKGNASTAPYLTNGVIRLYQNGGYVMLSAVKGCKIDEVIVSTTSTYSTTVGYSINDAALATTGTTVAASNEWKTAKGLNADSVKVICLGTTSGTRLEFSKLTVKYTGEPAAVSSIELSGSYTTDFAKGAEFNHDGMTVTATYSDHTTADVTANAIFSEPEMNTIGDQDVTVSFGGQSTTYTIHIAAATVTELVLGGDYQKTFTVGEAFNHDGLTVTANYSDGTDNDVTGEATFSTPDMSQLGTQEVTVSFGGQSASYVISVKASAGSMIYETVDFTAIAPYKDLTGSQSQNVADYSGASFDMAFAKPQGSTTPTKYYNGGTAVRTYTGNTITINAVDPILGVDIVNLQDKDGNATTGGYTISGLETTTAVVTFSATRRFTAITVCYKVAKIGEVGYETLEAAFTAVGDGETIELLSDCSGNGIVVPSNSNFTVEFNNHTYTVTGPELAGSSSTKNQCFQLLKNSTITFQNGTIVADNENIKMIIQNYADLTLNNMVIDANAGTNSVGYVCSNNNGNTNITGGTVITAKDGGVAFDVCSFGSYTGANVTVDGAIINGNIEVSATATANTSNLALTLTDGTVNGNLIMEAGADNATITKEEAVVNAMTLDDIKADEGKTPESVIETLKKTYKEKMENGYASFCWKYNWTAPAGVKVYIAGSQDEEKVYISEVSDVISAGEGVILYAPSATGSTLTITASTESTSMHTSNILKGTTEEITRPDGTTYALHCVGGQTVFDKYEGETIPANKAYLNLGSGAPARLRVVMAGNTTTGMENAATLNAGATKRLINGQLFILRDGKMYNVQGAVVK